MFERYKKVIIVAILIAIGFFVYSFFAGNKEDESLLQVSGPESVKVLGQDIIRNLNKIDAIKLDASVFDHPVLSNLTVKGEVIGDQREGRSNPFLPYKPSVEIGDFEDVEESEETEEVSADTETSSTTTEVN